MSYYENYYDNEWSGTNGYGEKIHNPNAYYKAVNEDRYGFNSEYSEHQRDNYYGNRRYHNDEDDFY